MTEAGPAVFADGKDAEALRTIGEVAASLGIRQHVLRYWEEQFTMLRPLKRAGGRRYYRSEDVRTVETIDRLVHREGYTLKGAQRAMLEGAAPSAAAKSPPPRPAEAASPGPALSASMTTNFAYRARLIALRTTLVNALHEA